MIVGMLLTLLALAPACDNDSLDAAAGFYLLTGKEKVVGEDTYTPPEDTDTPPEDTYTPPEDTDTPPEDIDTPPEDIDTPPEDTYTPPEDTYTPPGDTDTPPCGSVATTVADLQQLSEGTDCDPETDFIDLLQGVVLNCVVVTTPLYEFAQELDAFHVADADGGPFSGIVVVVNKGTVSDIHVGDIVSVTGGLREYYCLSELVATGATVTGADTAVSTPVVEANLTGAGAEQWEGVLVTLTDVVVAEHDNFGGFSTQGGVLVDDGIFTDMVPADPGCTYSSLTGVVDFRYGKYQLLPRNTADLTLANVSCGQEVPGKGTIADIQSSQTSTTCEDEAFVGGGSVSLSDVVVTSQRFDYSNDKLHGYFVSDGVGGPNSGLLVLFDWAEDAQYVPNDVLDLEGDWTEFYCETEVKATSHKKTQTFSGDLPVSSLSPADLQTDTGEPYEGVVVRLSDVTALNAPNEYGEFVVTGDVVVRLKFEEVSYSPQQGEEFASITGPVGYSFGAYKIMPRTNGDIVQK